MIPGTRQKKIANIVRQRNRVTVNELSKSLNISRETIRRDLAELARVGKVQKFHGGACLPIAIEEGAFRDRMGKNVTAKVQIATEASKIVSPGETILIDTGSTSYYFTEKLIEISHLTIVTNSVEIAKIVSLSPVNSQSFLLGGEFHGDNRQTVGNLAITQVRFFQAHHAILTTAALGAGTGVMDLNFDESQLAQAMIEQAEFLTVIADSSKFNQIASFKVCSWDQVTNLVCDQQPTGQLKAALMDANVNIICPESA